jgi:hypothetical protein
VAKTFLRALAQVTSCVTNQRPDLSARVFSVDELHTIAFADPAPLQSTRGGQSSLLFDVVHVFALVKVDPGQWRVSTRMYQYSLLDHDQTELLVYHWQPGLGFPGPDYPHLHVSASLRAKINAGGQQKDIGLDKRHLVTGRVSLESVVRMLLEEFDIKSQRSNWADILDETEAVFLDEATQRN